MISQKPLSTRKSYGLALAKLAKTLPEMIVLDAEMKNSTFSELFEKENPDKFLEMFIAEQNMISVALGLSLTGKIPFCSTFGAFLTRAFDQIRMSQYSKANLKICGSHCGVSIGQDGPSQMALEDIAMFSAIPSAKILYPATALSCEKLVFEMSKDFGINYLRTTRADLPELYEESEVFPIGGSKTFHSEEVQKENQKENQKDNQKEGQKEILTIISAGITLHEVLLAQKILAKDGILIRVIDAYSVKPLDILTIWQAHLETGQILVVEDHFPHGGLFDIVLHEMMKYQNQQRNQRNQQNIENLGKNMAIWPLQLHQLAVTKTPRSGKPEELLADNLLDAKGIVEVVKKILRESRARGMVEVE